MTGRAKPSVRRAQPVGSLLRPDDLKAARAALTDGGVSVREYKALQDRAVRDAIALQEQVGLEVVTDGEQRRFSYLSSPYDALGGFESTTDAIPTEWYTAEGEIVELQEDVIAREKLSRRRSAFVEEVAFARAVTDRSLKVTIPCPMGALYAWHPTLSVDAYPDPYSLFSDMTAFLRQDVEDLVALGCDYIQVDAPEFTALVDERRRREFEQIGIDPERLVDDGVASVNALFEGLEGVRVAMHMCRGNWDGKHMAEGGYDAIAKRVFQNAVVVDDFFLEYDDERSGSFEALADVPSDKIVMLGLVSTKRRELEDIDQLLARIDEASQYFLREQMGVSTQCGFASGWEGNPLSADDQRAKLELVVETARRAWPE